MNNDGEIERYECSFGGYVFSALNAFNAFINNKTDTLKLKDEDIEYLDNMIKVNEKWKVDFVELSEALSNLDTKDAEARNELLNKFKYFAPAFFLRKKQRSAMCMKNGVLRSSRQSANRTSTGSKLLISAVRPFITSALRT